MFCMFSTSRQQQQQWQYVGPYFSTMSPFPNNTTWVEQNKNGYRSHTNRMFANNEKTSFEQYPSQAVHYKTDQGQNRVSYERRANQEQYASYPHDATYRRASGPGWQRQEVFYPAKSYK